MMSLEEQKLKVCEKLPELVYVSKLDGETYWRRLPVAAITTQRTPINWPTEGLQVCHEAEKKLGIAIFYYVEWLQYLTKSAAWAHLATYEQRLEALTRVWFPERWS